jgi:anti-anti-sigma regulatory factor
MFEEAQRHQMWPEGSFGHGPPIRIVSRMGTGHVMVAAADMTSSDQVRDLFNRCRKMLRQGVRHMVIDLHGVEAADTKLVACLVVVYQMARSASARLEICLSNAVLEVARMCRLDWLARELSAAPSPRAQDETSG